jgi:hypothetical protein
MTDPTTRQRGCPTETGQQFSYNNLRRESNIWSQDLEWARHLEILTDCQSQRDFDYKKIMGTPHIVNIMQI